MACGEGGVVARSARICLELGYPHGTRRGLRPLRADGVALVQLGEGFVGDAEVGGHALDVIVVVEPFHQ
jgi:hypothetical protein